MRERAPRAQTMPMTSNAERTSTLPFLPRRDSPNVAAFSENSPVEHFPVRSEHDT